MTPGRLTCVFHTLAQPAEAASTEHEHADAECGEHAHDDQDETECELGTFRDFTGHAHLPD